MMTCRGSKRSDSSCQQFANSTPREVQTGADSRVILPFSNILPPSFHTNLGARPIHISTYRPPMNGFCSCKAADVVLHSQHSPCSLLVGFKAISSSTPASTQVLELKLKRSSHTEEKISLINTQYSMMMQGWSPYAHS